MKEITWRMQGFKRIFRFLIVWNFFNVYVGGFGSAQIRDVFGMYQCNIHENFHLKLD